MTNEDAPKSLDDLLEPGSTLMVGTTSAGGELDFHPLTVAGTQAGRIDILLDTTDPWTKALRDGDVAHVTMSDNRKNVWVTLRGTLATSTDPARIDELWNPFADAYFDQGRETPGITVLTIDADEGRYWATPSGRIGSLISVVKAKLGTAEQSGEHGDLAV